VAAYQSERKAQTKINGESLQEFTAAVMQLAHQLPVRLPENLIQREETHTYVNGMKDQDMKQRLLIGSKRSPDPYHAEFLANLKKFLRLYMCTFTKPNLT
jgi:predicted unusual protein kinase regulating ubiquinone biosynthesis (AarF/ABC1/UbiB family)